MACRALALVGEGITAGEVVKDQGIVRLELRELFVHQKALVVAAPFGVIIAEQLQRFYVPRVAADDAFHEFNLNVQRPLLLAG